MKKFLLITITLFLLAGTAFGQADEQNITSNSALELNHARSLWANSSNAAGLAFLPLQDYNKVSAYYNYETGNYKLQQEGDNFRSFGFNTNGAFRIGKIALWGNFTFADEYVTGSLYNTSRNELSSDMPFFVSDCFKSNWRRQYYEMDVKAAFPLGEKLTLGVELGYMVKQGAKQRDPRVTAVSYKIDVKPSLVFKINDMHHIGANFRYYDSFDRDGFSTSITYSHYELYIMGGFGNYFPTSIGGTGGIDPFYYNGSGLGGGLQYGFSNDKTAFLLDLTCNRRLIETFETPNKPQRRGDADNTTFGGKLQLLFKGATTHKFNLQVTSSATDGIEYLQKYVPEYLINSWVTIAKYIKSTYKQTDLSFQYDVFGGAATDYSWKAGAEALYNNRQDEYILPHSEFNVKNAYIGLHAGKNFFMKNGSKFFAGLNAGRKSNISGNYAFNVPEPNHELITGFFMKDFAYLMDNYWTVGLKLDLSIVLKAKSSFNIDLGWKLLSSQTLDNRNYFTASVAYIF